VTASLLRELIRSITLYHWRVHWLRTLLTVVGISLGVANVIAVSGLASSVLSSFQNTVHTLAGESELEILPSAGGDLSEDVVAQAMAVEGVSGAAGLIETFLPVDELRGDSLYLLGVDFLQSPIWRAQIPPDAITIEDELSFLAQLDSLMLASEFPSPPGTRLDSQLHLNTPAGPRSLTVRGILRNAPVSQLFDGRIGVMDLPAAQALLGREGRIDRAAVSVATGTSVGATRDRLSEVLGPGVRVDAPEARGEEVDKLLLSLRSMLFIAGSLAVIVGVFIVFNTVSVSVQQRRRELALLATVGVRRRAIVGLCLLETLLLTVAGLLVGLLGGRLLAVVAAGAVGAATSEIWTHLELSGASTSAGTVAGLAIGLVTSFFASGLAIYSTLSAPTVEALRPLESTSATRRLRWVPAMIGLGLIASTWTILLAPPRLGLSGIVALVVGTQVVAYGGIALLGPSLVEWIGRAARRLAQSSSSAAVRLAAENIPRTPARSGATVATIVAAVGMAISLTGLVHSFEGAWLRWLEHHFGADLFVGSGARFHLRAGPAMDMALGSRIAGIPGVESVEPFRVIPAELDGQPIFIQGLAVEERLAHGGLAMVQGTLAEATDALKAGTGVLISDNLATRLELDLGEMITLPTPQGPRLARVEGTYVDYLGSLDLGAVLLAQDQLQHIWGDRYANLFRVWLEPNASTDSVRRAILASLGGQGFYVITAGQFLDGVRGILDSFFVATWALVAVAVLVAVIGIINSELATVLDRRAEITMLRTIGFRASHLVRAVLLECASLGALGGAAGLALGAMLSAQFVDVALRLITGWRIPFHLHLGVPLATFLFATGVAALAGWVPALAATRLGSRRESVD